MVSSDIPRAGQMVIIRERPAVVRDVVTWPLQSSSGVAQTHAVDIEYIDGWDFPASDRLIWERELGATVVSRSTMPQIDRAPPDDVAIFDAMVQAFRWETANRLAASRADDVNALRLLSPWQSAVQVEHYQVYPVLKALSMSRIGLLIADDVGLGKTIEAGLIVTELIARRRVRRVLIICPAALQQQWRDEMRSKFYLDFTIVDRDSTFRLRREQGIDANPWNAFPRIITSMDYLRQAPVLEEFRAAGTRLGREVETTAHPWQLLIVDEAHNVAPTSFSEESQRTQMLRHVAPNSEHRVFLTATPHNGYTASFTGLMEMLDPIHFSQEATLSESSQRWLKTALVRRLKRELNEPGKQHLANRAVKQLSITLHLAEQRLHEALRAYRQGLIGAATSRRERVIAEFVVTILTKRLLSSTYAFARTWRHHIADDEIEVEEATVNGSLNRAREDIADDVERQQRDADAARLAGMWLRRQKAVLAHEQATVTAALTEVGWSLETIETREEQQDWSGITPPPDARVEALLGWIAEHLRLGTDWRADERVVLFTEYKDTLDYLLWRLALVGYTEPVVAHIYGGIEGAKREAIKAAFTDPYSPVRILLGTDAISEGINLQESCRYVVHVDIPWNPMRMEQRNGRVDRHGQARDVFCWHFASNDASDLRFLGHIAQKIEQVHDDLGSVGEVIDAAVLRHFTTGTTDEAEVDRLVSQALSTTSAGDDLRNGDGGGSFASAATVADLVRTRQSLARTELDLGLTPTGLAQVLTQALALDGGSLVCLDADHGVYGFERQPPTWRALIKDSLALTSGRLQGAIPKIVFDPAFFQASVNGRSVYRPQLDTQLVRLGHPLMRRAIGLLRRQLWSQDDHRRSRWTVTGALFPALIDMVLVVHVLVEANNLLRETLHQEILTLPFEVNGTALVPAEERFWQSINALPRQTLSPEVAATRHRELRRLWPEHRDALEVFLGQLRLEQRAQLTKRAQLRGVEERASERQSFDERLRTLRQKQSESAHKQLQRDIQREYERQQQSRLFADDEVEANAIRLRDLKQKLVEYESDGVNAMITLLEAERTRTLDTIIPRRYTLTDDAPNLYPIALEYRVRLGG